MEHLKVAGRYVAIDAAPRRRGIIRRATVFVLTFTIALTAAHAYLQQVRFEADGAARSDYADLVNSCFDKHRTDTADALYSCIAGGNP